MSSSAITTRSGSRLDWRDALAGAAAAAGALGASELLAGLLPGGTSLVAAVGQVAIDLQPPGAKDVVVALFGTNDKLALEIFVVAVGLLIGAGLGLLARRRFELGAVGLAAFGVVGFLAASGDPVANIGMVAVAAAVSVGTGVWLLDWLPRSVQTRAPSRAGRAAAQMPDWSRRSFLVRAAGVGVAATVGGLAGRALLDRQRVAPAGAAAALPPPAETAAPLATGTDLSSSIAGLTPIVMPNDRFYRIDTSLLTPGVSTDGWTLRIHGLVDRETTLTWDELIGAADVRAVRDDLVRQQRGRRQARRQREMDRRPAARRARDGRRPGGGDAARRALGRRLDRRHADGLGHGPGARADDRAEDERRAAAAGPRLPGPPDRARPVRLRVGDEVAQRSSS